MQKKIFGNVSGIGLIEVMVAIGLLAVVAVGISGLSNIQLKQQTQSNITFQADSFRRLLIGNINNAKGWANTISANPALSCLASGGTCTNGAGGALTVIKDANNNTYYAGGGTNGLTQSGSPCSSFNATPGSGNDQCPFQFQISWTAQCTTGGATCGANNTMPLITLAVVYNPSSQAKSVPFNASQYGANFYQGAANSNLACQWQNNSNATGNGLLTENCAYNVGVGTVSPNAAYSMDVEPTLGGSGLYVMGDITLGGSATLHAMYVYYASDARLKTDLHALPEMQNAFSSLHPVLYRWNDKASSLGMADSNQHLGLLAQDVEKSFPEAVKTDANGLKSVDYALMVVPAIQAIKDLQSENKLLHKRLDALEKALDAKK